jgi:arylsulfatase
MASVFFSLALLLLLGCGSSDRLLLLITVDTLRADHLGAYGNEVDLTPQLDALAEQSVRFTSAYAPAPFTLPSTATLLTGMYPEELGIYNNPDRLPDDVPTLATLLGKLGWRTGAVVGNVVLHEQRGLGRGFDVYDDRMEQREAVRGVAERIATDVTDSSLALLDDLRAQGGDVFLWIHYQDPHGPYTPPEGFRERYLAGERERPDGRRMLEALPDNSGKGGIPNYQYLGGEKEVAFYRAGYAAEVSFVDEQVGRLLAGIRERVPDDRAIIVFTADHGELLGERDQWFAHGEYLTDELVRVPLLIRAPDQNPAVRDEVVSFVDLLPTLLALVDSPRTVSTGRDVLSDAESSSAAYISTLGESSVPRRALVVDDYQLEVTRREEGVDIKLQRRADGAQVQEEDAEVTQQLLERLLTMRRSMQQREPQRWEQMTDEDVANLKALGYVVDD